MIKKIFLMLTVLMVSIQLSHAEPTSNSGSLSSTEDVISSFEKTPLNNNSVNLNNNNNIATSIEAIVSNLNTLSNTKLGDADSQINLMMDTLSNNYKKEIVKNHDKLDDFFNSKNDYLKNFIEENKNVTIGQLIQNELNNKNNDIDLNIIKDKKLTNASKQNKF